MRTYRVSKESDATMNEKIELINSYDVGDLLYVLRDIEANPRKYDEIIIKGVVARLYDKGIRYLGNGKTEHIGKWKKQNLYFEVNKNSPFQSKVRGNQKLRGIIARIEAFTERFKNTGS